jgi:hypothetical protein
MNTNQERRIERLEEAERKAAMAKALQLAVHSRVQEAVRDTFLWVTRYTRTYNEHWLDEGRPSPYEPFPPHPYFKDVFDIFDLERVTWIEKSRDLMVSWACVAYLTLNAMKVRRRGVLFQTQTHDKARQLVRYAKQLYRSQPSWLQDAYPLTKSVNLQSDLELHFMNGSSIVGIPGGADQIRSYHPWGYLNDESSFQPESGECYNQALAAVRGKIIFNSSAGPGWYSDVRRGIIVQPN